MARTRAVAMSLAILSILALSTLSFAAAADRIAGAIATGQTVKVDARHASCRRKPPFDRGPARSLAENELPHAADHSSDSPPSSKRLTSFLLDQQNPRSASYHKWLTPEQYASRFGLSPVTMKKITDWLQSQGFTIVQAPRAARNLSSSAAPPPKSTKPSRPSSTISRATVETFFATHRSDGSRQLSPAWSADFHGSTTSAPISQAHRAKIYLHLQHR